MSHETILTEIHGRVGIMRLNRPEKLNAWNNTMSTEIVEQITRWNADHNIGAIMMTGAGRAFCAGADIDGFAERVQTNAEAGGGEMIRRGGASFTHFLRESKPTVTAGNGYADGVGLTMILPFDVRIASTEALLSIRFIKMGLMPELGSTRLLANLVGLGPATDMCLTGRMVPADEALAMGLVSAVTTPDKLEEIALAKAEEIANNPTETAMMIKELLRRNPMDADLEAVMERENIRDQSRVGYQTTKKPSMLLGRNENRISTKNSSFNVRVSSHSISCEIRYARETRRFQLDRPILLRRFR